jgi:autoinducer 2-degrading protein
MKPSESNSVLTRIVKMNFLAGKENDFLEVFETAKEKIRAFEGCVYLELFRDMQNPAIFFTYSQWIRESHLETYRHSELFQSTWAKTKILFAEKVEAWSLQSQARLS